MNGKSHCIIDSFGRFLSGIFHFKPFIDANDRSRKAAQEKLEEAKRLMNGEFKHP